MGKNKRDWEKINGRKHKRYVDKNSGTETRSQRYERLKSKSDAHVRKREILEVPENENMIIGRNPVIELLKSERDIDKLFISKNSEGSINKIIGMAKDRNIVVSMLDKSELDRISGGRTHQGVIAFASAHNYADLPDIYRRAEEKDEEPFVVILDNLEDPHNLGAIMRTAECAGAHGVIIPKRRSCGLTETVAKTSAGAIEYVPCVKVPNIAQIIDRLKDDGFWIAACDMGGKLYYKQDLTGRIAVIIGSEGKGISPLVKKKCDFTVSMPMVGNITSLNASNAAAVLMYEVRKQRDGKK